MKRADVFSDCHPVISLTFFALVITFSMLLLHPACLLISLFAACAYAVYLSGKKAVSRLLIILLPLMLFTAVLNPLFSHEGVSVLAHFPNGAPLTLESIYYGLAAAAMLASVVCWFACVNLVLGSDKLVFLFGRLAPAISLLLSMTLRFVPRFVSKAKELIAVRKCLGRGGGNFLEKAKNAAAVFSILVTWSMENAVDTADSMKSRGYGLKGRTSFAIYSYGRRDRILLAWLAFLGAYITVGAARGVLAWRYYPSAAGADLDAYAISVFLAYFALCLTPLIVNIMEAGKWKYMQSAG